MVIARTLLFAPNRLVPFLWYACLPREWPWSHSFIPLCEEIHAYDVASYVWKVPEYSVLTVHTDNLWDSPGQHTAESRLRPGFDCFEPLVLRDEIGYYGQSRYTTAFAGRLCFPCFTLQSTGTYPPPQNAVSPGTAQPMDPFFDDDEDDANPFGDGRGNPFGDKYAAPGNSTGNAYGMSTPNLGLTANAVPPAGVGASTSTVALGKDGMPPGWAFDDDEPVNQPATSRSAPASSSGGLKGAMKKTGGGWKWPWAKEKVYEGERQVWLNDQARNIGEGYPNNYVSTSKYNLATFIPKFLVEQFSKYANLFFLFTAFIQQVPGVSPTNRYTTIAPLSLVLLASAFKEISEDLVRILFNSQASYPFKRHQSDSELNSRTCQVLDPNTVSFVPRAWKDVRVGDLIRYVIDPRHTDPILIRAPRLESDDFIPQASHQTAHLTSAAAFARLAGHLRSEQPNNSLYTYEGTLELSGQKIPMSPDQLLLRGAQMRNTPWCYGLVVFTGHETKAAPIKRTAVERQGYAEQTQLKLIASSHTAFSLIVTMEVVKYQQAQLINSDLDMYYAKTDTPALCRTSSLVEELGQIEYIFSDKTGTLTRNEMEFRQASIAGVAYADIVDESKRGEVDENGQVTGGQRTFAELRKLERAEGLTGGMSAGGSGGSGGGKEVYVVREFLSLLAVCHTVIPEMKGEKLVYQASSPDEAALVAGAELLGYKFYQRKPKSVFVEIAGVSQQFDILNVCEFNSTRKRMSTVVRGPDGKIKLYCKGADTVILERLTFHHNVEIAPQDYATEGLRTLCLAMREIPEAEYQQWSVLYDQAAATINGRGDALDKAAEIIEKEMFLLGATAIEDKLQEGVPETIHTLQMAGIKVRRILHAELALLYADRGVTGYRFGFSPAIDKKLQSILECLAVIINEENAHDTQEFITKRLNAIKNQRKSGELEDLALVIDGKSLTWALEKEISKTFLELAILCKAVVCCKFKFWHWYIPIGLIVPSIGRVSPLQKALVVKLVKKNQKSILLAIGDGANDVSMIQAAHVGIGISGVEGLQAARSADVAISQFRYLKKLLLVHGSWSYQRLSKLILCKYSVSHAYSFFNNFSGQIAYESWTLSFYNVIFTVLPPLVIGVFDQFVSARMLDRYPQLYMLGQQNAFFTPTSFWLWFANVLYGFSIILFWGDLKQTDGLDTGHWFWGTTLYLAVLLTVLGKAALVSDLWTKYTVAAIPGSFIFTMIFLPLYALAAPAIGFSTEYAGIVPRLWENGVYRRTYSPASYHIAQELQKYNIPDYRPRQEQFQKAIKKVRAVQRMRRNRGFAFSQTEDGGKQDQARLIRAYDTSQSHARPSGL
ncbi:phospholipid-transporting ATPase, putative [Rhizoctonia solani AG-1 IA]|uniref:Phospholipid-transporting ATPase n=1 Tax=Thanatephorus cucumeris (strain AG1-IA) TaxID=983506 RepID=L8WQV4_THACA|nr:phospholipid-transporting ATPase, putative [Rhizoctonia solani AG-1 IA]